MTPKPSDDVTAKAFVSCFEMISREHASSVPKREVFALARAFQQMPVSEVIKLLQTKSADHRLGAVSILDWKARDKKTSVEEREAIYRTYIEQHAWIDDWGMVDRAAPYVVGGYLYDKPRDPLYELAKSEHAMERRTAIVSTYYFIRKNDVKDSFGIAEILVDDQDEYVQKAVGSWIREAGKRDEQRLEAFLERHAATMPRIMLRYAIEKLDRSERDRYLGMKKHSNT
ncbi:MAG: DNA alkylation repair protein [Cryomorphaceae bacterium]